MSYLETNWFVGPAGSMLDIALAITVLDISDSDELDDNVNPVAIIFYPF
jgi:hypothetical protein